MADCLLVEMPLLEAPGEGSKGTVIAGVDTVVNHPLQETSFPREACKKRTKGHMKPVPGKGEGQTGKRRARVTGCGHTRLVCQFQNNPLCVGENMDPTGTAACWTTVRTA